MTRQQLAGIFHARAALHQRLQQITDHAHGTQEPNTASKAHTGPCDHKRENRLGCPAAAWPAIPPQPDSTQQQNTQHATDRALPALARAQGGSQLASAKGFAASVGGTHRPSTPASAPTSKKPKPIIPRLHQGQPGTASKTRPSHKRTEAGQACQPERHAYSITGATNNHIRPTAATRVPRLVQRTNPPASKSQQAQRPGPRPEPWRNWAYRPLRRAHSQPAAPSSNTVTSTKALVERVKHGGQQHRQQGQRGDDALLKHAVGHADGQRRSFSAASPAPRFDQTAAHGRQSRRWPDPARRHQNRATDRMRKYSSA